MTLDLPTLMLAGSFVSTLCASFLFFVWWQTRAAPPLWWAAADLALGVAVALLAVGFVRGLGPLFMIGLTLLLAASALLWSGIRRFFERPAPLILVAVAFLTWFAAVAVAMIRDWEWMLPVVNTGILVAFGGATIRELVNRRQELRACDPLVALISLHILILLLAIPEAITGNMASLAPPALNSAFGLIHFESIIYVVGTTVFLVVITKERSERRHMHDAQTDALTGLANRRAFMEMAERIVERCRRRNEPIAVVIFDLDHFKLVNDTFGHAFGDDVLRMFAKVAREALRPGDIISRAGGEEFFAMLPGSDRKDGCAVANRVRKAFADGARVLNGRNVKATVSAGVMVDAADVPLNDLLEKADEALYTAKLKGRNRVECTGAEASERPFPRLLRVA